MGKELKCWRKLKGIKRHGYIDGYEHKTGGFYAKISKRSDNKYSIMEYVGNFHFPADKPTWKIRNTKANAIKEAKRFINKFKC